VAPSTDSKVYLPGTKPACELAELPSKSPPLGPPTTSVVADAGSTAHFFQDPPVLNRCLSASPVAIANPNGSTMCSTHKGEMDLPTSPLSAHAVHVAPDPQSHSPLSIGQLCDAGCVATFAATELIVRHNDTIILQGHRTRDTNIWHIALPNAPAASANTAVGSAAPSELLAFAHASLLSPTLSALSTALDKGCMPNFPGLSSRTLRNSPPRSAAMIKGHLDQARKNQRSAKANIVEPEIDLDTFPPSVDKGAARIIAASRFSSLLDKFIPTKPASSSRLPAQATTAFSFYVISTATQF
jgi:hypothetical protein